MKIAVTYADGQVYQHFGHAAQFKLYTVESGMILDTAVVDATASGHSAMVSYLQRQGVNTVICGGIGGGAVSALAGAGIRLFAGATGSADQAVLALLAGKLVHNPEAAKGHCGGAPLKPPLLKGSRRRKRPEGFFLQGRPHGRAQRGSVKIGGYDVPLSRSWLPRRKPAATTLSRPCPTATTRSSAKAAQAFPAARSSVFRLLKGL